MPNAHAASAQMDAYLAGDDHALGSLFRLLAPRIRRVVQTRIDDPDLVDDIVQLTFVKAHRGRHAFRARRDVDPTATDAADTRSDDAIIAWYLAIARNTAVDGIRSERRHQHARVRPFETHDAEAFDEVASDTDDPETASLAVEVRSETQHRVRTAIGKLPDSQREVVMLHKIDGLPMQEVAARLHVRPGAARVRAHRAYLTLARTLGPNAAA